MTFSKAQHEYLETRDALHEVLLDVLYEANTLEEAIDNIIVIAGISNPFKQTEGE